MRSASSIWKASSRSSPRGSALHWSCIASQASPCRRSPTSSACGAKPRSDIWRARRNIAVTGTWGASKSLMDHRPGSAPEGRDIVAEASAWFAEFREGGVPAPVRALFDEWLRRSPEHIQAYLEVSAAWSELPTADPEGRIDVTTLVVRARASADDNVVALGGRGECASPPGVARGQIAPRRRSLPALAASISFAVVLLGLWFVALRADTYSTGIGEQRTVRLADGSTVELNALSMISVRLSKTLRDIELA